MHSCDQASLCLLVIPYISECLKSLPFLRQMEAFLQQVD